MTCNPGRPKYTFPAPDLAIEKNYMQLWRHGGDWKAEPNKAVLVNCHRGAGVWFLNTVHESPLPNISGGSREVNKKETDPKRNNNSVCSYWINGAGRTFDVYQASSSWQV